MPLGALLVITLTLGWLSQSAEAASNPRGAMRVGIEAGHGLKADLSGKTSGATSCSGISPELREVEVNLDVALRVKAYLMQQGYGDVVVFRGDTDQTQNKGFIHNCDADAYVSIHADNPQTCSIRASGFTVARFGGSLVDGLSATDDPSDQLVSSLRAEYQLATGLRSRTPTSAMVGYLYLNPKGYGPPTSTPAAIIEIGFLSGDDALLGSEEGKARIARGIASGIDHFLCPENPMLWVDSSRSAARQQNEAFKLTGQGFLPNTTTFLKVKDPNGSVRTEWVRSDGGGRLSTTFTPGCSSLTGQYELWVEGGSLKPKSNTVYVQVRSNKSCTSGGSSPRPITGVSTAVVLVLDVSGSMGDTWSGGVKIESAKQAALSFLELVRQEAAATGVDHRVAVVGFSTTVYTFLPLTNDFDKARNTIISLGPTDSTNLGAGIEAGLSELRKVGGSSKRFMILLSDGMTNTGLSQDEILARPVAEARDESICINTVGFGNPGDINNGFLRRIAALSGCGSYTYAATGLQLFGAFAQIRHAALGQVIPALSSYGKQVMVNPGEAIALGTFYLPGNQDELYVTLGWSGQGSLRLQLEDPTGRLITSADSGAHLYTGQQFTQAIIASPISGFWKVTALPTSTASARVEYFFVGSTRPGGVVPFSLSLPVLTVGGQTFALPGGLPTAVLVLVSVAAIAFVIWQQLNR